ncbi:unnamed protein product [Boreogadus saida]
MPQKICEGPHHSEVQPQCVSSIQQWPKNLTSNVDTVDALTLSLAKCETSSPEWPSDAEPALFSSPPSMQGRLLSGPSVHSL